MAELAIADNVFLFLTESVMRAENFYQEEFYIRRIHDLITGFLAVMPMKVSGLCVALLCRIFLEANGVLRFKGTMEDIRSLRTKNTL